MGGMKPKADSALQAWLDAPSLRYELDKILAGTRVGRRGGVRGWAEEMGCAEELVQ